MQQVADQIALTPKGEAYAARFDGFALNPSNAGLRATRVEIEAEIERLIAMLDAMDGDPDLEHVCEDEGAEHDGREPALGWTDMESRYCLYGLGVDDEQEEDDPAGGDILDEPHDEASTADLEPDEPSWQYPNGAHLPGGGSDAA